VMICAESIGKIAGHPRSRHFEVPALSSGRGI